MNASAQLLSVFFALCVLGIVAALLVAGRWSPIAFAIIGSLAALVVMVAAGVLLFTDATFRVELWPVLTLGKMVLAVDRLSALFVFVTGMAFLPVSVFSSIYLGKYWAHYSLAYFGILYHGLFAAIVLVLIAHDAISFLVAWELMSIASYLLVNFEYERQESSHAAFVMLAMSEAGTIPVAIAFILVAGVAGTFEFDQLRSPEPGSAAR
jgi:hydrogenase-4 component B